MRRWTRRAPTTTDRSRWRAALGAALLLVLLQPITPARAKEPAVRLRVAFGDGARLGQATSLTFRVDLAPGLPAATEVRLLTAGGIDLSATGLGMATCKRPATTLLDVMTEVVRAPCPGNALMGTGTANAQLRFDPEEIFDGDAALSVYSGESVDDKPGLIVIANAHRPVRTQLTYRGYLYVPPPEFGVGMAIQIPPIPRPPFGAPVALSSFRLVVGAPDLRYVRTERGQPVSYHPRAIPLPARCPERGFRFRVIVRLTGADGSVQRHADDAVVPCPQQ